MRIEVEASNIPQHNELLNSKVVIDDLLNDIEAMRVKLRKCQQDLQPLCEIPKAELARQQTAYSAEVAACLEPYPAEQLADWLDESELPLLDSAKELPDGFSGATLVELEEIQRQEEELCAFVLDRARALAWQAVRHTPSANACASTCLNWISQARLWAERRQLEDLSASLAELEDCLDKGLPRLNF